MNIDTIQSLPDEIRKGTINESEAMNCIFSFLFNNKAFFGLKQLDEDSFNDFLIYIFENLKKSFSSFDKKKSSFSTYLQNIVRLNYKSWLRIKLRSFSVQQYINDFSKCEYYEKEHAAACFSDISQTYNVLQIDETNESIKFSNIQLLAIALKSSFFLTPRHINALAVKTGYDEEYIWKLKNRVDEYMTENYNKNDKRIETINKSYYFRQRALNTLQSLPKDHPLYNKVYNTFKFHDTNWQNKRNKPRPKYIVPVNKYIAHILDVPENLVNRAITKAKKISISRSKIV